MIGLLSLHLHLPGCTSLKEKRGRLQPVLHRLQREFNLSAAEMDLQDRWQEAFLQVALVSNDRRHLERSLAKVCEYLTTRFPDVTLLNEKTEFL